MQFDSVREALDHLCSYAGQDGDEAAVYITGEIARLREAFAIALQNQKEASADWLDATFANTELREKLSAAEHEIEVLNMIIGKFQRSNCPIRDIGCGIGVYCGTPECRARLREEAERQLKEEEHA
ncbi:MAG: hypothetical protein M0P69_20570 [Bacteroidales bacterium]|nr:hypothetical protein [Bacteroidales bacterium]